nr:hypothetical protein [Tanacetum cinerariifolium]
KTPKLKYVRKKANSDTSPKQNLVQATKGTRIKTKAKVAKSEKKKQPAKKINAKRLAVLSKAALTEVEQLKLAMKEARKNFTDHMQVAQVMESTLSRSDKKDDNENDFQEYVDINDDDSDDERTKSDSDVIPDPYQSNEEHDEEEEEYDNESNIDDEETMYDDEDDEVLKVLYEDVIVNLGNKDTDMTNADQGGVITPKLCKFSIALFIYI